jgi:NAD+ kinase
VPAAPVPTRIALVVHPTRTVDKAMATLAQWTEERGVPLVQVAVDGDGGRSLAAPGSVEPDDLVVALGGDGTVLWALRAAASAEAPVLGVACGSLGALSAVKADGLADGLDRVWAGDWAPRSLPALAIEGDGQREWAANDFVVVRRGPGQIVAELSIDDELYARIAGDGVIAATALGSSAYSMAAGGPILAAGTAGFVCTPVAMHGGSAPPVVVPADATAAVVVHPGFAGFDVEVDGHRSELPGPRYALTLHMDKLTLVTFTPGGRGLSGLRKRLLVFDSPRILARDERTKHLG